MPHYKDTPANRKLGRVGKAYGKVTASSGMKFKIKAKPPPVAAPKAVAVKKVVTLLNTRTDLAGKTHNYVPGKKGQYGEKIAPLKVKLKIRPKPDRKISSFKAPSPSTTFASLMPPVSGSVEKMTGLSRETANKMSPEQLFGMLPKELGKMVLLPSQRGGGVKVAPQGIKYDIYIGKGQKSMAKHGTFNPTTGLLHLVFPDVKKVQMVKSPEGKWWIEKGGEAWDGGFQIGKGREGEPDGQGHRMDMGELKGGYYGIEGYANDYIGSFLKALK